MLNEIYDCIGIGIGFVSANIDFAVMLTEAEFTGRVIFLERASSTAWQPGMLLEGSDIQHNPLRDFATPRNPRSQFGFLTYLETFDRLILSPRNMKYKIQFPGPTGTNAIEAALKLARKVTGRTNIVTFSNAYHGMTLGALAATASPRKRAGGGLALTNTTFFPYDGYLGSGIDTADLAAQMIETRGSGIDAPAAILLETVQGEGGLASCSPNWLKKISALAKRIGALLILDDIQAGCGRTGTFFSFEGTGVEPDIITLSKSLSGFGTPFAIVLLKSEYDQWSPGEHNGTFRGNNLGFVGATAAIENFWSLPKFSSDIQHKSSWLRQRLSKIANYFPAGAVSIQGRGLLTGLAFVDANIPIHISHFLYERGVIIETCGPNDEVLKFLPPLTIEIDTFSEALVV